MSTILSIQTDTTPRVNNVRFCFNNQTKRAILHTGKKWLTLPEMHAGPHFGALLTRMYIVIAILLNIVLYMHIVKYIICQTFSCVFMNILIFYYHFPLGMVL